MLPFNIFMSLLSGSVVTAASEISNIKYYNLSLSPLTAQRYPSEGWQATFDFDISDASSIVAGDYFTLSLPYVYRIKLGGLSGSESMIINLDNGSAAFECSVTQQAAYLYRNSILTCKALMSFSDYSSLAGQLSFSINFDAGGSVYKYELEDANFFKAGGMQVPFGSQMSTEVVFDKVPLPDYYYTFGRTTGYGTAQIYYLDMFCPNGYLLGGTETINFDNRNGGFNIDCSSLQTYLSKNFNDFLLPLDVESNTPDNICYGNTVQITVNDAGEGAMLFIDVLQDVRDGDQSIEHSISMHYSCMDTLAHTTYTTDIDRLYVFDIYNGADSGTITATQSITALSTSTSAPSSVITTSTLMSSLPSSSSLFPSPITSSSVVSTKTSSTAYPPPSTDPSSTVSKARIVVVKSSSSFSGSSSSTSPTTQSSISLTTTNTSLSTSSPSSTTSVSASTFSSLTTSAATTTISSFSFIPSTSAITSTSIPIVISKAKKSPAKALSSAKSSAPSSVTAHTISGASPLSQGSLAKITKITSSPSHSAALAATSFLPTSSTSDGAPKQISPSSTSLRANKTPDILPSTATTTTSILGSPEASADITTYSVTKATSSASSTPVVRVAGTTIFTISISSSVTPSPSNNLSPENTSDGSSVSVVSLPLHSVVKSRIAEPSSATTVSFSSSSQIVANASALTSSSGFKSLSQTVMVGSTLISSPMSTSSVMHVIQKSASPVASLSSQMFATTTSIPVESKVYTYTISSDYVSWANGNNIQRTTKSLSTVTVTASHNSATILSQVASEQTYTPSEVTDTVENSPLVSASTRTSVIAFSGESTRRDSTTIVADNKSASATTTVLTDEKTAESSTRSINVPSNLVTPSTSEVTVPTTTFSEGSRSTTTKVNMASITDSISSPTVSEDEAVQSSTRVSREVTSTLTSEQTATSSSSTLVLYSTLATSGMPATTLDPLVPAFTGLGVKLHVNVFSPMVFICIISVFFM